MSSSEIQHARDYVTRVKTSLGQNSNQYKLFLTTLKSYRTRQLSPTQVISRINDIFSEDNVVESGNRRELILGTLCLYSLCFVYDGWWLAYVGVSVRSAVSSLVHIMCLSILILS